MKHTHKSIFNLIEIFRKGKTRVIKTINLASHCESRSLHDYYCDAEKPHITKFQ
ncbi:hypothetical protein [Patiriisocius hiemis]|uniref:Uncharacterized protein n=1 Tax=Patiriisocius hiemis TaxID=3075604 RepID=A0ABU2YB27_9FLAO|nr:hypothetical protein [Constantimarinum sp. W242]MDT0555395.1 hypothetical protein [Constantimarinum sp. W242]